MIPFLLYLSMELEVIGLSLDIIGTVLIAYPAIAVHSRFWKEHKVDEKVFKEMRKEQILGMIGIVTVMIGFTLQLYSKLG